MTDDFELRLRELLNEHVDAQLGPRRPVPSLVSRVPRRRHRARWIAPLLAAAAVLAIVLAALATGQLGKHATPAAIPSLTPTPGPTSAPTAPTTTSSDTTSKPTTRTSGPARSSSTSPVTKTPTSRTRSTNDPGPKLASVHLGGATIVLPHGWVARDFRDGYLPAGATEGASPRWCLTPPATPRGTSIFACPISFTAFHPSQATLDPDEQGGYYGDPPQALHCFPSGEYDVSEEHDERQVGGRAAEYRQFTVSCPTKPDASYVEQQYVVDSPRGYVLNAYHATGAIRSALATIVDRSVLPAPDAGGLRLADRGRVRSVQKTLNGIRITLRRTLAERSGRSNRLVPEGATTYRYVIPQRLVRDRVGVGDIVYLATDGSKITEFGTE